MRKIKKSIAVFAVLLLMTSSLNANVITFKTTNCFGLASWVYDFVLANGGSYMDAVSESANALQDCFDAGIN